MLPEPKRALRLFGEDHVDVNFDQHVRGGQPHDLDDGASRNGPAPECLLFAGVIVLIRLCALARSATHISDERDHSGHVGKGRAFGPACRLAALAQHVAWIHRVAVYLGLSTNTRYSDEATRICNRNHFRESAFGPPLAGPCEFATRDLCGDLFTVADGAPAPYREIEPRRSPFQSPAICGVVAGLCSKLAWLTAHRLILVARAANSG
jgi:hypothetical protein